MANFALIGAAGYVAPRHLRAIAETGNRLIAAVDPADSVGILDSFDFDVHFFTEIERFDRHLEKLRRGPAGERVHYVTVCSPNYLHDAHCRLALRVGADVICEKPLVIKPWNLDLLQELERETGRRINTVLQLRVHPALTAVREQLLGERACHHDVCLTYVTPRGRWYGVSWKGSDEKSGGLPVNLGIHLFDLLIWLFGRATECHVHLNAPTRMAGVIELERARVRWFLSCDPGDVPTTEAARARTYRSITVDGREIEFTDGFNDLHTEVYRRVLAGQGFGIDDVRPATELVHRVRTSPVVAVDQSAHPLVIGSGPAALL